MDAFAEKVKFHTIEDMYALPDGKRAKLIDGQIYDIAPPNTKHQKLLNASFDDTTTIKGGFICSAPVCVTASAKPPAHLFEARKSRALQGMLPYAYPMTRPS